MGVSIEKICNAANEFLWGPYMLALFLFCGIYFTLSTGFLQIRHIKLWWKNTACTLFTHKKSNEKGSITQMQALSTALAATVGTGNITGVAAALLTGGPGAIFWMWISAFLGMMTAYAENVLGILYRYRDKDGKWVGGAMIYMDRGLHAKPLAILFSFLCVLVSFGMGNMAQIHSVSSVLQSTFSVPKILTGILCAGVVALSTLGGLGHIVKVTERLVPFMVVLFLGGSLVCLVNCAPAIPSAFVRIFHDAFTLQAAGGGAVGYGIKKAMRIGISRGVFSNEAGLGSAVAVHAATDVKEPAIQGMWGMFEVFIDTIVVCTMTALVILTSGVYDLYTGVDGTSLTATAYAQTFGGMGAGFIAISTTFFAIATTIGWSFFGESGTKYLFGEKGVKVYRLLFVAVAGIGALGSMEMVWGISDIFNVLMAVPNLIAILCLSGQVRKETRLFIQKTKKPRNRLF
ncbi:MAG: sodium:alanine symporter family protein [Clostridia bacterium]|nr:sodium:alanine symporter family protein [Clostridia bacterium]